MAKPSTIVIKLESTAGTGTRGRRNIFLALNRESDGDMRETYYRDTWESRAPNRADEARAGDSFGV